MQIYKYTVMAGAVVEKTFPPTNVDDVEKSVTALNLLNAIVKLQEGKTLTSYHYIKGMVARLFVWLLHHPIAGVAIDLDEEEGVTYICVKGTQYSFHHVPIVKYYVRLMLGKGLTSQQWDGVQRQMIAADLFRKAVGSPLPHVDGDEAKSLIKRMCRCTVRHIIRQINDLEGVMPLISEVFPQKQSKHRASKAIQEQSRQESIKRLRVFVRQYLPDPRLPRCKYGGWKERAYQWRDTPDAYLLKLSLALKFNGWWEDDFQLARMGDRHIYTIATYDGTNYAQLVHRLVGGRPLRYIRPEKGMRKSWRYFIRRHDWAWKHMTYNRYLLLLGHCNYLKEDDRLYNLCITYGLARYLSVLHPELRFVNVLNFTRFKVHRRVYTPDDLKHVGIHSKSRILKVWLVIDPLLLLSDLDVESLPHKLLEEFRQADDYYTFFRRVWHKDKVGLLAYERFHLLPPIYKDIRIGAHYAHVMNDEGKWAIYSLMQEEFETDFIYDEIFFDSRLYILVGRTGQERVIIHDMFNPV